MWSEFGGGGFQNTSAEETASREFAEETLGVVCLRAGLLKQLQNHDYTFAIRTITPRQEYYYVFVKRFPYDPTIPQRFAQRRAMLLDENVAALKRLPDADVLLNEHQAVRDEVLEKTELKWWPSHEIVQHYVAGYRAVSGSVEASTPPEPTFRMEFLREFMFLHSQTPWGWREFKEEAGAVTTGGEQTSLGIDAMRWGDVDAQQTARQARRARLERLAASQ